MASPGNRLILLADRDEHSRAAVYVLGNTLGLPSEVVDTGAEALAVAHRELPALVLLAIDLADPSGYEVIHQLRERFGEHLPIAASSAPASEPRDEIASLLLGADDYFIRPLQIDRFIARVRRLLAHAPSPRNPPAQTPSHLLLTNRERQILGMLVDGHGSADIARLLFITSKTVSTHIEHILAKLDVHSRAQAVAFAVRHQILYRPE